ncbi:tyrosine-type recombinase/integrase, partial [Enterobacter ludwigii]|uniref:tyrosine-type recombinase/integrase n=2 Tax=Enterobacter TaxID=547 RepID=UPI003BEEC036
MKNRLYLTLNETERVLRATDNARRGLRVSELTGLKVQNVDFTGTRIYIHRLKNSFSTVHRLQPELWIACRPPSDAYSALLDHVFAWNVDQRCRSYRQVTRLRAILTPFRICV